MPAATRVTLWSSFAPAGTADAANDAFAGATP